MEKLLLSSEEFKEMATACITDIREKNKIVSEGLRKSDEEIDKVYNDMRIGWETLEMIEEGIIEAPEQYIAEMNEACEQLSSLYKYIFNKDYETPNTLLS